MNYLLGFIPDQQSNKKISDIVKEISSIFSGQDISIRWVKPINYHITLQYLGKHFNIFNRLYLSYKLKHLVINNYQISISRVRIGTNRRFKGMVYLDIDQGGEALRKLKYEISEKLKIKDNSQFVPHITIGRINKELSDQEFSNLIRDIENVSKKINTKGIQFNANCLYIISNKDEDYTVVKNVLD